MEFYRIGDKLISIHKIQVMVEKILRLRMEGYSQQEAAQRLKLDRSFISRLESLGEVRKGSRVAVVGFPIKNKEEVSRILQEAGVDYQLIWTEEERQQFVRDKDGQKLLAEVFKIVGEVREYDVVVVLGSRYRIRVSEAMLDREVIGLVIGESPITEDVYVDPQALQKLMDNLSNVKA
ncbi:MAG TPA: transcriptional regulator [Clostridia bacterium]|nr:transcriptional regulator [Clostridia bacterium]